MSVAGWISPLRGFVLRAVDISLQQLVKISPLNAENIRSRETLNFTEIDDSRYFDGLAAKPLGSYLPNSLLAMPNAPLIPPTESSSEPPLLA